MLDAEVHVIPVTRVIFDRDDELESEGEWVGFLEVLDVAWGGVVGLGLEELRLIFRGKLSDWKIKIIL